ncbi:YopJ family acetyltransferase [Pantoea cypripedii]|uniref:YopJ family acetyltransferase n=1 Tax=Pantoea cypripedii TaxID=55209 RepID=UPI002FC71077
MMHTDATALTLSPSPVPQDFIINQQYLFKSAVLTAANCQCSPASLTLQHRLREHLYAIKNGQPTRQDDFLKDISVTLPLLVQAENDRNPALNLRFSPAIRHFISSLQRNYEEVNQTGEAVHGRYIVVNDDDRLKVSHAQFIDVSLKPGMNPSLFVIDSCDSLSTSSQQMVAEIVSGLFRDRLIQVRREDDRRVCSNISVIGIGAQKIMWDCVRFSLDFSLKSYKYRELFQEWHDNQHARNDSPPFIPLSDEFFPDVIHHSSSILPVEFIKHTQSKKMLAAVAQKSFDNNAVQMLLLQKTQYPSAYVTASLPGKIKRHYDPEFSRSLAFRYADLQARAILTLNGNGKSSRINKINRASFLTYQHSDSVTLNALKNHWHLSANDMDAGLAPTWESWERDRKVLPALIQNENIRHPDINLKSFTSLAALLADILSAHNHAQETGQLIHNRCILWAPVTKKSNSHHFYLDMVFSASKPPSLMVVQSAAHLGGGIVDVIHQRLKPMLKSDPALTDSRISVIGAFAQKSQWDCIIYCLTFARTARQHAEFFQACHRRQQAGEPPFPPSLQTTVSGMTDIAAFLSQPEREAYLENPTNFLTKWVELSRKYGVELYWPNVLPADFYRHTPSETVLQQVWRTIPASEQELADKVLGWMGKSEPRSVNQQSEWYKKKCYEPGGITDIPAAYLTAIEYARLELLAETLRLMQNPSRDG